MIAPVAGRLSRAATLSVASSLLWIPQAGLVAMAIGTAVEGRPDPPTSAIAAFVLIGVLRAALGAMADARSQAAAETVLRDLRAGIVFEEARRAGTFGAGAVAALAAEKVEALSPWILRYAPAKVRVALVPLVILAVVFWISWAAGVILLISGPLIPVFMALVGLAAKDASARQLAEMGTFNDLLVDRLSALLDIRVLGASGAVTETFAEEAGELRRRTMAVLRLAFLSSTVLELFAAIGVAMMAVYVGFSLLGLLSFGMWSWSLSPTAGILLLLLAPDFYQPLRDLAGAWHDKAAAEAVADECAAWRDQAGTPLPGTGEHAEPLPGPATLSLTGCVAPTGVALPSLAIAAGEAVALVGPSGAGKTSAMRLMAGLDLPSEGELRVAGRILTSADVDGWRARIG